MDAEKRLKYLDAQIEMLLTTLQDKKTSLFGKAEIGAIIAEHLLEKRNLVEEVMRNYSSQRRDIQKDIEAFNKHNHDKPYFTNDVTVTKEELEELTKNKKVDSDKPVNNLKQDTVCEVANFPIYQPLMERGFLVHLPNSLNITESDVVKCEADNLSRSLELEIRNNFVKKPFVTLANGLYLTDNNNVFGDVIVEILDATGTPVYAIKYKECKIDYFTHPKLAYGSSEVQKIKLMS